MPKLVSDRRKSTIVVNPGLRRAAQLSLAAQVVSGMLVVARLTVHQSVTLGIAGLGVVIGSLTLAGVIRKLERLVARSREEADLDPLTGLLNRAAFARSAAARLAGGHQRFGKASESAGSKVGSSAWGMMMIDLDDFGALNKRRGHLAGDALLRSAAARLRLAVEPAGLVGRLGGDELAALVPSSHVELIAREALIALQAEPEPISASIGVARTQQQDCDWVTLLRDADVALRVAKRNGKGQMVVFEEGIEADEQAGRRRVRELIDTRNVEIAVQPIVDLVTGRVHAYEALARFPNASPTSPAHWLSVAEAVGMRVELELVCLERSLSLLEELPDGTSLSVNLSALALHDPRATNMLRSRRPDRVIIEVTEEGLAKDLRGLRSDLDPLLKEGVKLAVDDMGAGYSNLRQVVELAPSLLKLDRALVHGIDADPAKTLLIDALVRYAQRTGSQIVAEGIETQAELDVLRSLDIPYGQGYLLARPREPWPEVLLRPATRGGGEDGVQGSRPVTIDAAVTADEARRRFVALPELESLVIVDRQGRPLALLTRHRLLAALGHRFGYSLWGERPALRIADSQCLRLAEGTPIGELARKSLARSLEHRHDPVLLVDAQGRLTGQVTMSDMLFAGYVDRDQDAAEGSRRRWAAERLDDGRLSACTDAHL